VVILVRGIQDQKVSAPLMSTISAAVHQHSQASR
jgi:hypothetical protein